MSFSMPMIGLGTMSKQGALGSSEMLAALRLGYRHIDTAQGYGNEEDVGRAVAESEVPREDIHITTKIAYENLTGSQVRESLRQSLSKLGSRYVDLTLIHWPGPPGAVPMAGYLEELAGCQEDGMTRAIGVSNFSCALLDAAVDVLGEGVIRNNQVEVHPFLQNRRVRAKCNDLGILVTGYMPVAGGEVMDDDTLKGIAARRGVSPSQIAVAWLLGHGVAAIPSSRQAPHLAENVKAGEIKLDADEMSAIDALDRGYRIINPISIAPVWDD